MRCNAPQGLASIAEDSGQDEVPQEAGAQPSSPHPRSFKTSKQL